jgi:hypothetical protein
MRMQLQSAPLRLESSPHLTIEPTGALIMDFPASRAVRNRFLFFMNYPKYLRYFVIAAQHGLSLPFI